MHVGTLEYSSTDIQTVQPMHAYTGIFLYIQTVQPMHAYTGIFLYIQTVQPMHAYTGIFLYIQTVQPMHAYTGIFLYIQTVQPMHAYTGIFLYIQTVQPTLEYSSTHKLSSPHMPTLEYSICMHTKVSTLLWKRRSRCRLHIPNLLIITLNEELPHASTSHFLPTEVHGVMFAGLCRSPDITLCGWLGSKHQVTN